MIHCREEQPCVGLLEFPGMSRDEECDGEEHIKGVWGREGGLFGVVKDIAMAHEFAKVQITLE